MVTVNDVDCINISLLVGLFTSPSVLHMYSVVFLAYDFHFFTSYCVVFLTLAFVVCNVWLILSSAAATVLFFNALITQSHLVIAQSIPLALPISNHLISYIARIKSHCLFLN